MRAGRLRTFITIEQQSTALVGPGDQSQVWTMFLQAWAEIVALTGKELVAGDAVQNLATYQVRMRYSPGVTARMRVRYDDAREGATRYLNIVSPPRNTDQRGAEMIFEVQEGVSDG